MSNIIMAHGALTDALNPADDFSFSSEEANFPFANVFDIQPTKVWRTTGKAAESIAVDFGAVTTFDFLGLFFTNIKPGASNTVRIRTADTYVGCISSPDYDSGAVQAIPTAAQDDYGYQHVWHQFSTTATNQWALIELVGGDIDESYIEVGRFYLSKLFQPDVNIEYGWSMGIEDDSKPVKSLGGPMYVNPLPKLRVLQYSLGFNTEDDMYDFAFAYDRQIGASGDIFVHKDIANDDRRLDYGIYGLQYRLQPIINKSYNIFTKKYSVRELL